MTGAAPPPGAWDCHCHVFGPAARFPYAEPRSYTPEDAPLEAYLALLDRLGLANGVLVQPSAYGRDNRAMLDALRRAPQRLRGVAVVVDHMGRMEHRHGVDHPGFQALLREVGEGRFWAKVSGTYRLGATPPDYAEARAFHDALVAANPANLVWGTDWPHPRPEGPVPDAVRLLAVLLDWTNDPGLRQAILVDNPSRLYG